MNQLERQELQNLILSVGTHQASRRLSPLEVAYLLKKALDAGATLRDCSATLRIGTTQVRTFLKLLMLAPDIQHLADWRGSNSASIPFSTMAELARLPKQDQIRAAKSVMRHGLTWKEVVQLVQMVNRSGKPIKNCIEDILRLRPQVETRHIFVGAIIGKELQRDLATLSQGSRDIMLGQALAQIIEPEYGARGRLGEKDFTILSNHNVSQLLDISPDEIEHQVNLLLTDLRIQSELSN